MDAIAVTGAGGKLGSRVVRLLADSGVDQLMLSRDPSRLPDLRRAVPRGPAAYDDTDAMRAALQGAGTLVLISGHLSGRRLAEHTGAVDAALAAGVRRVIYVSLMGAAPAATYLNARDHWQTEQLLAGRGVRFTVLRPCFYASMVPGLAVDGVIRGSAGGGRAAFVAHDDIAAVIAAVAVQDDPADDGAVLEITGPESLTLPQAAAAAARATGKPLRYQEETVEEGFAWRAALGADGPQLDGWISWYLAIARDEVAAVSAVVAERTGRAPRTLAETLTR